MDEQVEKRRVLVVDDTPENIDVLVGNLADKYELRVAVNGKLALQLAHMRPLPDLILLDIMMPEMDGYEVCEQLKSDPETVDIPIIFLTAKTETDDVVKGFDAGAIDYVTKPFNPAELLARVKTQMELKTTREKNEQLLNNILPKETVAELREYGKTTPKKFDNVTVLMSDLVNFTSSCEAMDVATVIAELNELFTAFDELAEAAGCERIKTIGDAYMAVAGMPQPVDDHADRILKLAAGMVSFLENRNQQIAAAARQGSPWQLRIGIHSGPLVGGVVGVKKYIYDVFGDTVNMASRLESNSTPMKALVSKTTAELAHNYRFEGEQTFELKGKGSVAACFLSI